MVGDPKVTLFLETIDCGRWIQSAMRAGQDRNVVVQNSIPDEIRKTVNHGPTNISIDRRVNKRTATKSGNDLRDFVLEFCAKTVALSLVPNLRRREVKLRSPPNLDIEAQRNRRLSRAFTSGQGL